MHEQIILGVDPGTVVMGFSVISCKGKQMQLNHMATLNMHWEQDVFERLQRIYNSIDEVIKEFKPNCFAIEAPFYGKNVQSMLKLGRAQGVAIACALQHRLPVTEYSPKKVKQSITGNGNATKDAVWQMLKRYMLLTEKPKGFDASDALAVAVCHHFQLQNPVAAIGGKDKGWDAFIRKNPGRVRGL